MEEDWIPDGYDGCIKDIKVRADYGSPLKLHVICNADPNYELRYYFIKLSFANHWLSPASGGFKHKEEAKNAADIAGARIKRIIQDVTIMGV